MWCWIIENPNYKLEGALYRFTEFYGPLIGATILNIVCCGKVILYINNLARQADQISIIHKLGFYPVILIICWLPATIDRIQNLFSNNPIYILQVLHIGFGNIQGFLDALVYGLTPSVREEFLEKIKCSKKKTEEQITDVSFADLRVQEAFSQEINLNIELGSGSSKKLILETIK